MKAHMNLEQFQRIELMGNVCSTDAARPILTGLYWHTDPDGMRVAGTDSYKMAATTIPDVRCEGEAIIPAVDITKASQVFGWTARRHSGTSFSAFDVQVYTSGNSALLALRYDSKRLASMRVRLIDGPFPKYQTIIDEAEARSSDDEPNVALNPYHMTGLMKSVPHGDHYHVYLEFKGYLKPVLAKCPADKRWTGLIMPVRT